MHFFFICDWKVRALEAELVEIHRTAAAGRLVPLPGETATSCAAQLGATSKTVGSSMAQLLTAAAQVTSQTFPLFVYSI